MVDRSLYRCLLLSLIRQPSAGSWSKTEGREDRKECPWAPLRPLWFFATSHTLRPASGPSASDHDLHHTVGWDLCFFRDDDPCWVLAGSDSMQGVVAGDEHGWYNDAEHPCETVDYEMTTEAIRPS